MNRKCDQRPPPAKPQAQLVLWENTTNLEVAADFKAIYKVSRSAPRQGKPQIVLLMKCLLLIYPPD